MGELKSFYRKFPSVKFMRGEVILHQYEEPKNIYAIKNGVVEASNITENGNHKSITFTTIDDVIPLSWATLKAKKTLFYYQAWTDCELYVISKQDFLSHMADSPSFLRVLFDRQMSAFIGMQIRVDALERTHSRAKILYTFRMLCLRYGKTIDANIVKIQIPLTQQQIADFTGLTRETATVELNKLRKENIFFSDHKFYNVDIEKLNKKIGDEYDPGVEISMLTKI